MNIWATTTDTRVNRSGQHSTTHQLMSHQNICYGFISVSLLCFGWVTDSLIHTFKLQTTETYSWKCSHVFPFTVFAFVELSLRLFCSERTCWLEATNRFPCLLCKCTFYQRELKGFNHFHGRTQPLRISSFCLSVLYLFALVAVGNLKGKLTFEEKGGRK